MNSLPLVNAASLALQTIRSHKMRALLTVLGIVIGTGTIMGVAAILSGFDSKVEAVLESFGPNSIIVFKFQAGFRTSEPNAEERARRDLTYENAVDIRDHCDACAQVSPILIIDEGVARYKGNDMYNLNVLGVNEAYAEEGQVDMDEGRFFTANENLHRASVAVLGADIAKGLFADVDPIGKIATFNGQEFEVIGTMKRPAASMFGADDTRFVMPFFTLRKKYPTAHDVAVVVNAKNGQEARALDQIRMLLRVARRVPYSKADDFAMSTAEEITSMIALVMVVLSSIGLLVGGIGVMNIMLVSVTERTKEIGVRKAIGARKSDIVLQFLMEAVVLTALGGLMGIAFGWLISLLSRLVFPSLAASVPLWAAVMGLVVSAGTGLFFGIWPASKAARLDPVEALRYE